MANWIFGGICLLLIVIFGTMRTKGPDAEKKSRPVRFHAGCRADALLLPLTASEADRRSILECWESLIGSGGILESATTFGDLVVRDSSQRLLLVDTTNGAVVPLADAGRSVDVAQHEEIQRRARLDIARELVQRGVEIPADLVFDWFEEPWLGGAETVENVQLISFLVQQVVRAARHSAHPNS